LTLQLPKFYAASRWQYLGGFNRSQTREKREEGRRESGEEEDLRKPFFASSSPGGNHFSRSQGKVRGTQENIGKRRGKRMPIRLETKLGGLREERRLGSW